MFNSKVTYISLNIIYTFIPAVDKEIPYFELLLAVFNIANLI